jgi:hypothetical protein
VVLRIVKEVRPCARARTRPAWPGVAWRGVAAECRSLRVRVEIMGFIKYDSAGKSQSVLVMINPIVSTRTRISSSGAV